MADLGDFLNLRADKCPKEKSSRFCFSAGVCLPFDQYILTVVNVGGKEDRERFAEIVEGSRTEAGHSARDARCQDRAADFATRPMFSMRAGDLFRRHGSGAEFFGGIAAKGEDDEDFFDSDPELENLVNVDF